MNDKQIRIAAYKLLFHRYRDNANIVLLEEVGLRHGAARIDFLIVKELLHGIEIKSDRDSLVRLNYQIPIYNSVLDRVTLVVGYRLADKALEMLPIWWGVKLARKGKRGGITFHDARTPKNNPNIEKNSVVKLLWQNQALEVLAEMGADQGFRSKNRKAIYARLSQLADLELIRAKVRHYLRLRPNAQVAESQKSDGD